MKNTKTRSTKKVSSRKKPAAKSSKETFDEIFDNLLKSLYWAEKNYLKAQQRMIKAANNPSLEEVFNAHIRQTEEHLTRLEQCFEILSGKPQGKKCETMMGLLTEVSQVIQHYDKGHARDAALIATEQKIHHYKMSVYGSLTAMGYVQGKMQCAELLKEPKEEAVEADKDLSKLAERINRLAAEIDSDEESIEENESEEYEVVDVRDES